MKTIQLIILCWYSVQFARADNVADAIEFVGALTTILGQILSRFLGTDCTDIKALFGVQYNQLNQSNKPDLSKVTLNLCTTNHTATYNLTNAANQILADPGFNPNLPITIFVHGFFTSMDNPSVLTMTSTLLKRAKSNVMYIDATSVIFFFYLRSSTCVQFIGELLGKQMAAFVAGLSSLTSGLPGYAKAFATIGLGSHISGFAGKTFQALTGTTLGRISGLDPAGPCFFVDTPNHTLTSTDASFVDVIHTNGGVYGIVKSLGTKEDIEYRFKEKHETLAVEEEDEYDFDMPSWQTDAKHFTFYAGHVDFYPNGGAEQPSAITPYEAHHRVWRLYAESLLYEGNFLAVKCANWTSFLNGTCASNEQATMGIAAPPATRGIFYLKTGGYTPYGLGVNGTTANPIVSPIAAFLVWWNSLFGIK